MLVMRASNQQTNQMGLSPGSRPELWSKHLLGFAGDGSTLRPGVVTMAHTMHIHALLRYLWYWKRVFFGGNLN